MHMGIGALILKMIVVCEAFGGILASQLLYDLDYCAIKGKMTSILTLYGL